MPFPITKPGDLPECPACGSREVFVGMNVINGREWYYYTCKGCGRDNTQAWREINPPRPPLSLWEKEYPFTVAGLKS